MDETTKPVDRQTLYEEVWTEPVSAVAPRYGLSDVGLAKLCRRLSIPLPMRGYWAKIRAGKKMGRAALPPLPAETFVRIPDPVRTDEAARLEKSKAAQREARAVVKRKVVERPPGDLVESTLVTQARARLSTDQGWNDPKGLRHAPKEVLDISVSATSLDRALTLVDRLLLLLEAQGMRASVDAEKARTCLKWESTIQWFGISEKISRSVHVKTAAEERQQRQYYDSWRTGKRVEAPQIPDFDYAPTGLLTISVGGRNWNDTPRTSLDDRLDAVAADILAHFVKTRDQEAEQARKRTIAAAEMAAYNAVMERRKEECQFERGLVRESWRHYRAELIRKYVAAALARGPGPDKTQEYLDDWASRALLKADHLDPLVDMSDLILDAPEPERPQRWWWPR